jgi:AraC-like DNA-binding protein
VTGNESKLDAFSPIPKILHTSMAAGPTGVIFHEIESPRFGAFDGGSEIFSLAWTLGPLQVRYGNEKHFSETFRRPRLTMPGDHLHGEYQGVETSLLLFIEPHFVEVALGESKLVRPNPSPDRLTKLEHYLKLIRTDVREGSHVGPTAIEFLTTGLLNTLFPDDERSLSSQKEIHANRFSRMTDYIDAHLNDVLSLPQIAAQGGVSVRHMSRSFKTITGCTPHEYIIRRRLERAVELIDAGHSAFSDIAISVGFSSHAHMTSVFRRVLNRSPSQFRNT